MFSSMPFIGIYSTTSHALDLELGAGIVIFAMTGELEGKKLSSGFRGLLTAWGRLVGESFNYHSLSSSEASSLVFSIVLHATPKLSQARTTLFSLVLPLFSVPPCSLPLSVAPCNYHLARCSFTTVWHAR